jgi:hypothetical protein
MMINNSQEEFGDNNNSKIKIPYQMNNVSFVYFISSNKPNLKVNETWTYLPLPNSKILKLHTIFFLKILAI